MFGRELVPAARQFTDSAQSDANVNTQFLAALTKIRGAALSCTYSIPDSMGRMADYGRVNVRYTPCGSTMSVVIPKVANAAD